MRASETVRDSFRVIVRVTLKVRFRVRVQTPWNHTPDTMDMTKKYWYCRHHGIIHQTLCMLPGNMDIIGTADSRKPYRIHDGHLQTQHTSGSHTQTAIYATSNYGHHALCRDLATIHQIQWIPQVSIDNVDNMEPYNRQYTMVSVSVRVSINVSVCLCLSLCQCQLQGQSKTVSV